MQDGSEKQISKTDLAEAIDAIRGEIAELPDEAFAHCFQEGNDVSVRDHAYRLRYLAPADIDADPHVQIIFFKTSLNTGWDCPRAEVMMSFRTALDATSIAQLIGRMVRAPLARPVGTDDHLNTVGLYLPHYDKGGVDAVIARLAEADPDGKPPVDYEKGEDVLELRRDDSLNACFHVYQRLPSYVIPRPKRISEVKRLMKLARLLANDEIDVAAVDEANEALLAVLMDSLKRLETEPDFAEAVGDQGTISIRAVDWVFGASHSAEQFIEIDVSKENLEDLFDTAGRKLGEGLHRLYWKARCLEDIALKSRAKLEAFALAVRLEVIQALEATAKRLTQEWLNRRHHKAIFSLPDGDRQRYNEIYRLASEPELLPGLVPPPTHRTLKAVERWQHHLYIDDAGEYSSHFNTWEDPTLREELGNSTSLVGWLRNPSQKDWAICVPYILSGEVRGCYPDFVVFRTVHGELRPYIVDPHSLHLPDAPAKAAGMARFADRHAPDFGGIDLVIVNDDQTVRLDLTDEATRERVRKVENREHLQLLFDLVQGT